MKILNFLFVLFALNVQAEDLTSESLRNWQAQQERVESIGWSIRLASSQLCTNKKYDYGITSVSLNKNIDDKLKNIWREGLGVDPKLSTIVLSHPSGPARKSGIFAGEVIVGVNDVMWSGDSEDDEFNYRQAFKSIPINEKIVFHLKRADGQIYAKSLVGVSMCDIDILIEKNLRNARASGSNVFVGDAVLKILNDDNELAFIIAHEVAHILLGHTTPDKVKDLEVRSIRAEMEKSADKLGVELMYKAGFNPDFAAIADSKIYQAFNGPISKLLGLHGPYMSTEDRARFLTEMAAKARGLDPAEQ